MNSKQELIKNYLHFDNCGLTYSLENGKFVPNEISKEGFYANLSGYLCLIYIYKRELYATFGRKKARKIFKKALTKYRRLRNVVSRMY